MKLILVLVLGTIVAFFAVWYYLTKTSGTLGPILPTVFFEPADDSNVVAMDFGACAPAKGAASGEFGSIQIEMWSWDVNTCLMDYTNPEDKNLLTRCLIPKSLDKKTFKKTFKGVDFLEIASYCKAK